jgi:GntR family transcriptional regulator
MHRNTIFGHSSVTEQIVAHLKQCFVEGKYQDGDRLPSITALAEEFGVSVASMREALRILEALDLVEIIQGKGTYVRPTQLYWQAKFTSFSEIVRHQWGKIPGARLLKADTVPADAQIAAQLQIGEGLPAVHLQRLRLADNEPIAIEDSYLPAERFRGLLQYYRDPMSLYQLLENKYGVRLVAGLQTLEATLLSQEDSELLSIQPGQPGLFVSTIAYDIEKNPVEYGTSLFRGDRYRYVVRLTR